MAERTPGPYLRDGTFVYALDQRRGDVFREENVFMASVQDANGVAAPGELEATAEFIVRACNAHDALVAAALGALERCVACGHERQWHGERDCAMCAERDVLDACRTFRVDEGLRAAVALAEEAVDATAD